MQQPRPGEEECVVHVTPVRHLQSPHINGSKGSHFGWRAWLQIAAALAAVVVALRLMTRYPNGDWLVGAILILAVGALTLALLHAGVDVTGSIGKFGDSARNFVASPPVILIGLATLASATAVAIRWDADRGPAGWDVAGPWLAGVMLFALAAWWPSLATLRRSQSPGGLRLALKPNRRWLPWLAMIALAAVPRLAMLDRFPGFINGDEGQYLLMAVNAREGTLANPFATGWLEVPHLYPAAQGWLTHLTSDGIVGHRVLGAAVGTIGVLATWRFGRHIVGARPALAGAGLMATLPFHLLFSRSALNHIMDPTTLVLALLFLWRGIHAGRRGEAFLAGLVVGLGWYGYWGARVFPMIVALLLAIAATDRRLGWRQAICLATWAVIGFLATTAPLLVTFLTDPNVFRSRLVATSLGSGTVDQGSSRETFELYVSHLRETTMLPFIENWHLFFRHRAPFLGWPVALLVAVGCAAWIAGVFRSGRWRHGAWLFMLWVVLTLGVAVAHPVQSQRFVALSPFWMLAAGCGVVAIVRGATAHRLFDRNGARGFIVAGVIVSMAVFNLLWMTSDERQFDTWGDVRSLTTWDIGWRIGNAELVVGEAPRVLVAGAPFMFINDWGNLQFQAPNAEIEDVNSPMTDVSNVPGLPPGTLLLLIPERIGERCAIEKAHPDAAVAEVRAPGGELLYLAFYRQDLPAWSTGTTPDGTTFATIESTPCPVAWT